MLPCVGVIAATFVCPLDVIKTRFQVHGLPNFANGNAKGMEQELLPVLHMHICITYTLL